MKPRPGQASIHRAIARTRRGLAPLWAQGLIGAAIGDLVLHVVERGGALAQDVAAATLAGVCLAAVAELDRSTPRWRVVRATAPLLIGAGVAAHYLARPRLSPEDIAPLLELLGLLLLPCAVRARAAQIEQPDDRDLGRIHDGARLLGRASAGVAVMAGVWGMCRVLVMIIDRLPVLKPALTDVYGAALGLAVTLGLFTAGAVERRTRRGALREAPTDTRAPRAPAPPA